MSIYNQTKLLDGRNIIHNENAVTHFPGEIFQINTPLSYLFTIIINKSPSPIDYSSSVVARFSITYKNAIIETPYGCYMAEKLRIHGLKIYDYEGRIFDESAL